MRASLSLSLILVSLFWLLAAGAQQATITPNYKDADIRQVIEAVGEITGKNFIIDPRVKAQVTMLSSAPMTTDAFYEAFLSILQVYGFVAVPSGDLIKILPDANARQMPGAETGRDGSRSPDDIVTQIIAVENVAAAQLVPILRPLIPQYGHLAAHPPSNMLIISDRAANVSRMLRIVRRIDQAGDEDYEVIRLQHASAGELVRIVTSLNQSAANAGPGGSTTVVADERTNSVLISGDKNKRLRLRVLITHLDTPLEDGGDARVRYLRYADAEELATKLQAQYEGRATQEGSPAVAGEISIWADQPTNALILTAPPKVMRSMMAIIDKLDIRRLQVLLEAIIVEVSAERAADLGVTWAIGDQSLQNAVGVTKFDNTFGVAGLAGSLAGGVEAGVPGLNSGLSVGIGRLADSGLSFVALIEALEADTSTNIMGTPIITTMDNEEAEIRVGQEVPFVTGSFTNTGAAGGSVNPFTTVEREQVGLTLKITPVINEGDAVRLKIEQEISSVSDSTQAVDLITNNRTITTAVIVEDKAILVLGGLIQEDLREKEQRVPILGSIPLIGALFRSTSTQKVKTNLMFFIKPTILRNSGQAALETNSKYNYIRDMQLSDESTQKVLPFIQSPKGAIPELEDIAGQTTDYYGGSGGGDDEADAGSADDTSSDGVPAIDLRQIPDDETQGTPEASETN